MFNFMLPCESVNLLALFSPDMKCCGYSICSSYPYFAASFSVDTGEENEQY